MSGVYLGHLASALGSCAESVEDAGRYGRLRSEAGALRDAGFDMHHVCDDVEDSYTLARRAFDASGIDPQVVDAIVFSTCLPANAAANDDGAFATSRDVKHLMQFPASRLQAEFGMRSAFVIGLNQQACTGMLGALRIARNLLLAEPGIKNVACVTADRFPEHALYEQSYNLISDGAAACLVSRTTGPFRLLDVHHVTNGAMVDANDDETVGSYFNYTSRLINEALQRAGLSMDAIQWVVPQNTNRKAWEILSGLLDIDESQAFFPTMAGAGHVISADNIMNLAALHTAALASPGERVLTVMAGYGSNWQWALLEVT